jgi:Amt family ammonium transporter
VAAGRADVRIIALVAAACCAGVHPVALAPVPSAQKISGGIAERARFGPQLIATAVTVGMVRPLFEGGACNGMSGVQARFKATTGAELLDFAGSVVVHAIGGWLALPAVLLLGARRNRHRKDRAISAHPPLGIAFHAHGAWVLAVGWFGFNLMSARTIDKIPGLVAVCAGSDLMHPIGALATGGVAAAIFVTLVTLTQNKWKIDDVLGVWPLHGLCRAWGGIAAGIFGSTACGGLGGVSFTARLLGTLLGVARALVWGVVVYGALKAVLGLRLTQEEEFDGADLASHRISATPQREANG